jgi:hypothetical protein
VDATDVELWFASYLDLFVALGRGDRHDVEAMLDFYGVPMLLSAPGGSGWLRDADDVLGVVRAQVEGLQDARFDYTDVADSRTVLVNDTCARHEARFTRRDVDGGLIAEFTAGYLVAEGPRGPRIAALMIHGAPSEGA